MEPKQKRGRAVQFAGRKRILYASYWWLENLMTRVAHYATAHEWHLDLRMCLTDQVPTSWKGDGILTTRSGVREDMQKLFAHAGCPVVSLNLNSEHISIPCVDADVYQGARMAADHFQERGFRHCGYYTRRDLHSSVLACTAFQQAVASQVHTFHALRWQRKQGDPTDTWENRQQWLVKQLAPLPAPVAIFCHDPECAVEIFEACMSARLHVPDDVAILTALGTPFFNECTPIPLSSIEYDHDAQARTACTLLENMMNGGKAPDAPILIPPKGLSIRASTDTLAASTPAVTKAIRFMLNHYAEAIAVKDAVQASSLSRTNLFKAFQRDFGQSPHQMLTRIRLDKAKRMLSETDAKLYEVADACGFVHPVGLHHHFKQRLGMSPGAFRRQAANRTQPNG